jgi:hypothetical protein
MALANYSLPGTDVGVLSRQLIADLLAATVAQKHRLPDINQDVIAKVAARRHQTRQFLGTIGASTTVTDGNGFLGGESSDVQRDHTSLLGLEHLQRPPSNEDNPLVPVRKCTWAAEETKGMGPLANPAFQLIGQTDQRSAVFLYPTRGRQKVRHRRFGHAGPASSGADNYSGSNPGA